MQMNEATGRSNFDTFREVIGRRKWLAAVVFLVVFSALATIVWVLPDIYHSSATVLIERQQIPDELVRSTVTSALEVRLHTISQEILSRSRLEGLIDRFGLYAELRSELPLELVVERMRQDVQLELKGGGNRRDSATVAFTIAYTGDDPQKVASVTNALASFYIEENLKVREEQASGTSQFLRAQLEGMKKNLEAQEKRVSDYKTRYLGQLPHQQEANLAALEQLNSRLRLNADGQIRATERLSALENQLVEMEKLQKGTPDATATRIAELREELRQLRKQYSDRYPEVLRVKAEIAELVEQLRLGGLDGNAGNAANAGSAAIAASESSSGPEASADPHRVQTKKAIAEMNAELKALKAEEDRLRGSIGSYQGRVESSPLREQEFQVLMRDYDTSKELYESLLRREKEAELAENMEQRQKGEQFRIIEPALPSERPSAPNRSRLLLLGLALAIGLASGAVFLAEQTNQSFHTSEALATSYSLPVLVSIPRIVTASDRWGIALRFAIKTVAVLIAVALVVSGSYWLASGNERLVSLIHR